MYVCVYACVYVCVSIYVCMYVCRCAHIHIYIERELWGEAPLAPHRPARLALGARFPARLRLSRRAQASVQWAARFEGRAEFVGALGGYGFASTCAGHLHALAYVFASAFVG